MLKLYTILSGPVPLGEDQRAFKNFSCFTNVQALSPRRFMLWIFLHFFILECWQPRVFIVSQFK